MELTRFSQSESIEDIVAALKRDGAAILERQASDTLADRVAAELRPYFDEEGKDFENDFNGYKTLRVGGILARSRASAGLIGDPRILEIIGAILLAHCVTFRIGSTTGIEIWPGEETQMLHRDDAIYPLRIPGMELQMSVLWALDKFTL